MGYLPDHLEKLAWEERIPLDVTFEVTHRCNLACRICYLAHGAPETELSLDGVRRILDKLARAGTLFLTVSGGEPLLRWDLSPILDHAVLQGFAVTLKTGGTRIDREAADRLAALGLQGVHVSLLAAEARTHDTLTRVPGSFEKSLRAIDLLGSRKVPVTVMSVITRESAAETVAIISLVKGLKAWSHTQSAVIFPANDGSFAPLEHRMTNDQLRSHFRTLARHPPLNSPPPAGPAPETPGSALPGSLSCGTGRTGLMITPSGMARPCISLMREIGDLNREEVRDIMHSPANESLLRELGPGNSPCTDCTRRIGCFRCPGLALLEHGSPAAVPIESCRQTRIQKEIANDRQIRKKETV